MRLEGFGGTPAVSLTNATNADVELQPSGEGSAMVRSDGANDAKLVLTSTTKAVTLDCDANEKLSIKGGVNKFTLDASSATGGITFPDGTTQTSAASGGSLADWFITTAEYTEDDGRVNKSYPLGWDQYGGNGIDANNYLASYGGMSDSFSYGRNTIISWPFVAGQTGTLASVTFRNGNSWSGQSMHMALYSDDGGLPDTKLFSWEFDLSSAGVKTVTTFTGTASITKGTRYHLAYHGTFTSGSTHYFSGYQQMFNDVTGLLPQAAYPQEDWGGSENLTYPTRGWALNWDATSLPASFVATDSQVWPDFGPPLVAVNYELS